jgi:membrane-associated phospholipid phosphatase
MKFIIFIIATAILTICAMFKSLWPLDNFIEIAMHTHASKHPNIVQIMLDITMLGTMPSVFIFSGIVMFVLWINYKYKEIFMWATTMMMAGLWIEVTKWLFHRARPIYNGEFSYEDSYSFVSGHAAASLTICGLIMSLSIKPIGLKKYYVTLMSIVSLLIGFSRIYLGVHYFTDVIGGYALAVILLVSVWG